MRRFAISAFTSTLPIAAKVILALAHHIEDNGLSREMNSDRVA